MTSSEILTCPICKRCYDMQIYYYKHEQQVDFVTYFVGFPIMPQFPKVECKNCRKYTTKELIKIIHNHPATGKKFQRNKKAPQATARETYYFQRNY